MCFRRKARAIIPKRRSGLLSAANRGADTNGGHFSIVMNPAPHLDGGYTIFGEVVAGMGTAWRINKLLGDERRKPEGAKARIVATGCLSHCAPRSHLAAHCLKRAAAPSNVQGHNVFACLD